MDIINNLLNSLPNLSPQALEVIKLTIITLGFFHFLVGMYIIFQALKMKDVVKVQSTRVNVIVVSYIIVLLSVIFLAIIL